MKKKLVILFILPFMPILCWGQTYTVSTLAGSGSFAFADGTGAAASFNAPTGIGVDAGGNVYVADYSNNRIRKITSSGVVTTLAGSGTGTFADGTGTAASFRFPTALDVDVLGTVFVADYSNSRIRRINSTGTVTTFAGSSYGYVNATGTSASFKGPAGVAIDNASNVYVADATDNRIRKINSAGVVTTLAGSGTATFANGTGTSASFNNPSGVAVDSDGNVYVADTYNNRIRKIGPTGSVTTFAGSGINGASDGTATAASFSSPLDIAVDALGNVYVADNGNNLIRKITPTGVVSTIAGSGYGYSDGIGSEAAFRGPGGVAVDAAGNVYVADQVNNRIRKLTPSCTIPTTPTISGNTSLTIGGTTTLTSSSATGSLWSNGATTQSITVNAAGNYSVRVISGACTSATSNTLVVVLNLTTYLVSTLAGSGENGTANGTGDIATFNRPYGIAVDTRRNVYVAETESHLIRKISSGGIVTTFAGSGVQGTSNGTGTAASFSFPTALALDANNNLYVAEDPGRIRKITTAGVVTTLAGSSVAGYADGTGTNAQFDFIRGLAVDASSNVYVSDGGNHRIRKITSSGVVTTFAGSGGTGDFNGGYLDSTNLNARFDSPHGISIDRSGNIYVADLGNSAIRKIGTDGQVTTLAGVDTAGFADGTGNVARFDFPYSTAVDIYGNVYVVDGGNSRIRKITQAGVVSTIAGNGTYGNLDGEGSVATFRGPQEIALDIYGNIYVTDNLGNQIRKLRDLNCTTPAIPTITGSNTVCEGSSIILTSSTLTGNLWSTGDTTRTLTVTEAGSYYLQATSGACISALSEPFEVASTYCGPLFSGIGNYSSSSNWANSTIATQGTSFRVTGKMILNQSVTYADVRLMNGASIEITSGDTLTITGSLNNAGVISGTGVVKLAGANGQTFGGGGVISNLFLNNGSIIVQQTYSKISNSLKLGNNQTLNLSSQPITLLSTRQATAQLAAVPSSSSIINANLFIVQRWLDSTNVRNGSVNSGNYFLTGPIVQGQTLNLWSRYSQYNDQTFSGAGVGNLYLYNPTANSWYKPSSRNTSLPAGAGVQVWFGSTTFFNGSTKYWQALGSPVVGDYNLPMANQSGHQLLSNPYPSTIDWQSPNWTKTNVYNATYIYDWKNQRYSTFVEGVGTNGGNRYLATGQGFLVWANTNAPILTARENVKVSNQVAMQRQHSIVNSLIRLQAVNVTGTDELVIAHRETATQAFEPEIDALKFMNPSTNIYITGGTNQAIASMNMSQVQTIPFSILSDTSSTIVLRTAEFSGFENQTFTIYDVLTGEVFPYTPNSTYTFDVFRNEPYRLELRIGSVTGIDNFKANLFEVFPNPASSSVTVKTNGAGTIQILDIVGKVVLNQPATGNDELNISKLATGVYTVKVGSSTQKLVVR